MRFAIRSIGWRDEKNEQLRAERGLSFEEPSAKSKLVASSLSFRILPDPISGSTSSGSIVHKYVTGTLVDVAEERKVLASS